MTDEFIRESHPTINRSDPSTLASLPPVICLPLGRLLDLAQIHHFDFFSLDVEGGELEVLKSLDFRTFHADVICVEAATIVNIAGFEEKNSAVTALLVANGYTFDGAVGRNNWYSKKRPAPANIRIPKRRRATVTE